jgi:hypothetical protein
MSYASAPLPITTPNSDLNIMSTKITRQDNAWILKIKATVNTVIAANFYTITKKAKIPKSMISWMTKKRFKTVKQIHQWLPSKKAQWKTKINLKSWHNLGSKS